MTAVDIELCSDVCSVGFDGAIANAQLVGNFHPGLVEGNKLQDAPLGCSQIGQGRLTMQKDSFLCPLRTSRGMKSGGTLRPAKTYRPVGTRCV